ncbi:uncharacterized protein LOC115967105 [Quercus lobata]|uniref:uncharacterized protein LOC115967105 n=1 Tax=Quercus lobata TaxID=97700 RepID=UPI001243E38C|nr:uncharacterized protein LOC115967105 [Quercus lobata]
MSKALNQVSRSPFTRKIEGGQSLDVQGVPLQSGTRGNEMVRWIRGYDVKRVIVDQGSGAEIIYLDLYKGLNLGPGDLTTYDSPFVSFDGKVLISRGQIRLPVQASSEVVEVDFIVVDDYSPYTTIVARPWLHALGTQLRAPVLLVNGLAEEAKCEDLKTVVVGDDLEKFFQIGAQLPPLEKEELIEFLRKNVDMFAWSAYEAPRVDLSFICHHLNVNPSVTPKKQPPRCSSKDHFNAIRDEVKRLKQAGAIKEVF